MIQRHSGNGWLASGFFFYLILYLFFVRKQTNKLTFSLLYWYIALIIDLTLFPIPYNLEALAHIQEKHHFSQSLDLFKNTTKIQNFQNFMLFIPLGFLLPLHVKKIKRSTSIITLFILTLSIECTQLFSSLMHLNVRIFDVDDLFFNFLGGITGCVLYHSIKKHTNRD